LIDVKAILTESNAIFKGHFELRSHEHSDTYVECGKILQYTWRVKEIGAELALRSQRFAPDCVISATRNGMIIGYEMARNMDIPFIYLEEDGGHLSFTHCMNPKMFKNILIVEDVVRDGKIIHDILKALDDFDSSAIGIASIVKIGHLDKIEGLQVVSLLNIQAQIYKPEECPLCNAGIPLESYKNLCDKEH